MAAGIPDPRHLPHFAMKWKTQNGYGFGREQYDQSLSEPLLIHKLKNKAPKTYV